MTYVKLYVYTVQRKPAVFKKGGFRRAFLVTRRSSIEFKKLLNRMESDRPLYTLVVDKEHIPDGELGPIIDTSTMAEDDDVILIPCGVNSIKLPLYTARKSDSDYAMEGSRMIRRGVSIEKALLFNKDNHDGYIDEMLIDNPLDILKKKVLTISKGNVASTREVASALWKERNKVTVTSQRIKVASDKEE